MNIDLSLEIHMAVPYDVVVKPGDELAFAIRGYPQRLLIVNNREGLLYFQEYEQSIGMIYGKDMDRRLAQGHKSFPKGMVQLTILSSETPVRFSTPESYGKTYVHLDICGLKFDITEGTLIIGAIIGNKLEERLELKTE